MVYQKKHNPYQSPLPVFHIENLYGRKSTLLAIIDRLSNNSNFFELIGQSRIGKTSLFNIVEDLNNENIDYSSIIQHDHGLQRKYIFVSVNFEELNHGELGNIWSLIGRNLFKAIENLGIDIQNIRSRNSSFFSDFEQDLERIINELSLHEYKLVFLFDEFDIVARFVPQQILSNLRSILDNFHPHVVFITASQKSLYDYHIKRPIGERPSSPLHTYLDPQGTLYLGLMDYSENNHDVISYITEPAKKNGIEFSNEEISFVLDIGGRHPDFTRITCYYLFEEKLKYSEGKIDFEQIIWSIKKMSQPICDAIWSNYSDDEQYLFTNLATDSLSTQDITFLENEQKYLEMGLVIRTNTGFKFPSRIFTDYVKDIAKIPILPDTKYRDQIIKPSAFKIWDNLNVVQINGKLHHLRPKEMQILLYLVNHVNQVCKLDDLSRFTDVPESSLQSTISRLRRSIEGDPNHPPFIKTVYGEGYIFEEDQN